MNEDQKQPTSPVKTPEAVKPQTEQSTVQMTDQKQQVAPVKTTEAPVTPQTTQPTEQATSSKQSTVPAKAPDTVKPQPTGNTVSTVPAPTKTTEPAKPQSTASTAPAPAKTVEPVKPQTVQPTETVKVPEPTTPVKTPEPVKVPEPVASQPTQPTEVTKLSDVIPTSKVWISGLIGNRQIDCLGPIEIPLKIDEPTYPFTPIPSNPDYTNQVFDYDTGTWVPTDAKSQGQQLTDLTKEVADLQQTITKHEKDTEQAQQMSVQQMQTLMTIDKKLDALTKKEGIK